MLPVMIVSDPIFQRHLTGEGHPESPERTAVITTALKDVGLLNEQTILLPREATIEELLLCHTPQYINKVVLACQRVQDDKTVDRFETGDVNICEASMIVARYAVGGALQAVDAVMNKVASSVFCVIRPPGHHASANCGMGFCLFNNAAIAARYAQGRYGIKRVAIIDWDVHHGNGTQAIFNKDPSVFYFSTHRFERGYYPGTGHSSETGEAEGEGSVLNCPIGGRSQHPRKRVLEAFQTQLVDAMRNFCPELVIISAGFDARKGDPLGQFDLTDQDFEELTAIVKKIADQYAQGRIVSVLEGGYNLEGLASAAKAHVAALAASSGSHLSLESKQNTLDVAAADD